MKWRTVSMLFSAIALLCVGVLGQVSAQVDGADEQPVRAVSPIHADYAHKDVSTVLAMAPRFPGSTTVAMSAPGSPSEPVPHDEPRLDDFDAMVDSRDTNDASCCLDRPDLDEFDWMVLQSYRDSTWEVYLSKYAHGSEPNVQRLTYNDAFDGEPRLNHGCTQIAFTSNREGVNDIYRMDSEGGSVLRLTQGTGTNTNPTWSPSDSTIAFVSDRDGNREIYIMDSDGAHQQRLTFNPSPDIRPAFSPDGLQIAWIQLVDEEHGVIMLGTRTGAEQRAVSPPLRFLGGLVWSPKGDRLAFHYDSDQDGWSSLGIIGVDGSGLQTVPYTSSATWDYLLGDWSSSGDLLYYTRIEWILYHGRYYVLTISTERIEVATGAMIRTFGDRNDLYPDVAPKDISTPESHVHALPTYSRAGDVTVSYSTYDPGPAFVRALIVEAKVDGAGEWSVVENMFGPPPLGEFRYSGTAGQTVRFRSQAEDDAEHLEEWPAGDGDTKTSLYSWELSGQVMDNRGRPIADAVVDIAPAPWFSVRTAMTGLLQGLLKASGLHTVSFSHPGYGELGPVALDMSQDRSIAAYLPPTANWLSNGDFESSPDPFVGWRLSNVYTPTTSALSFTGSNSVYLSPGCDPPCLGDTFFPVTGDTILDTSRVAVQSDRVGSVHVLVDQRYLMRDPAGQWSGPTMVGGLAPGGVALPRFRPGLAVDNAGGVHAIVADGDTRVYFYKPSGGDWTGRHTLSGLNGEAVNDIDSVDISVNNEGVLAVTYSSGYTTFYVLRSPQGAWTEPVSGQGQMSTVAAGRGGKFHLATYRGGTICHTQIPRSPEQSQDIYFEWCDSRPINAGNLSQALAMHMVTDVKGAVHLALALSERRLFYWNRDPAGVWSPWRQLGSNVSDFGLDVDASGVVHIVAAGGDHTSPLIYYRLESGTGQAQYWEVPIGDYLWAESVDLDIDSAGTLHLVEVRTQYALAYRTSAAFTGERTSSLSTTLTIPIDAHRPTLAFMSNVAGVIPWRSLSVNVDDGSRQPTTVYSDATTSGWEPGWAPLDEWVGKTVTVTFAMSIPNGAPPAYVWLDAVTAGEWWTPVITDVTPHHFDPGKGGVLTIKGENLPTSPTVEWGDMQLADAQLIDPQTIDVRIPVTSPLGIHPIIVMTSQGQAGVSPVTVEIGYFLFLPRISR